MKVKICDKCKSKELINDLKKLNIELEVKCINFCGIGRDKYVVIMDNTPIITTDRNEIISKIKEKI